MTFTSSEKIREERAYATGVQAALWGRPFVEYLHTAYAGMKAGAAYLNYWRKFDALKTAADKYVNTPNNVSIDGYGNANLTAEPCVISVPTLREPRYYIVQIGDMFDEVTYDIGGAKGPEPGLFCITGPDYHGPIPANMKEIKMRTKLAVVALRVFVNGEADLPAARAVQQGFHFLPLNVFQKSGLRYEIEKLDFSLLEFVASAPEELRIFDQVGFGMRLFLSATDDFADPLVMSFRQIGLSVAKGFEWKTLEEPAKRGLARAAVTAGQIVEDAFANSAEIVDGWRYTMAGGRAGHDLALRAALASNLLGANVPEESLYPNSRVDDRNQPLLGANKYVLHFAEGHLPPVSVFWNLSMYDDKQFFIENDFGRYSIGSTTDGLKHNEDGSLTIYIQNDKPADTSNWLPAPKGSFNVTMRLYGSEPPILNGSYRLPPVTRK